VTPQTIFPDVRVLINDNDSSAYRYSDAVLLVKLDTALKRIALVRPDLFTTIAAIACTAGSTVQQVPNYARIIEVYQVVGGGGVVEANRELFDQTVPNWRADTAAPATNWMRHVRNPSVFFIYPQAPTGQALLCEYTVAPSVSALTDVILTNDVYQPVVQDMLVAVVEWGDDEFNLSQRAETFYKRALEALGITAKAKEMMDNENGGESPAASGVA
jgi:hypothetical protein